MEAEDSRDPARYLNEEFDRRLKAFGFDPGRPVYEMQDVAFTFEALQQALFRSTYDALPILLFNIGREERYRVPVVVELVQVAFQPQAFFIGERGISCMPQPDYYVRGYVQQSGFDPQAQPIVVHALVEMDAADEQQGPSIHVVYVQTVREPTNTPPDTPLRWGTDEEVTR